MYYREAEMQGYVNPSRMTAKGSSMLEGPGSSMNALLCSSIWGGRRLMGEAGRLMILPEEVEKGEGTGFGIKDVDG